MAVVKEFKVKKYNRDTYDANMLLAFEPNGDKVWIKEEAYDATTLAPKYTTEQSTALSTPIQSHNWHGLTNATVLSKYPFAYTALGELDDLETAGDEFSGYNIGLFPV
jgi:hypothetical protein